MPAARKTPTKAEAALQPLMWSIAVDRRGATYFTHGRVIVDEQEVDGVAMRVFQFAPSARGKADRLLYLDQEPCKLEDGTLIGMTTQAEVIECRPRGMWLTRCMTTHLDKTGLAIVVTLCQWSLGGPAGLFDATLTSPLNPMPADEYLEALRVARGEA